MGTILLYYKYIDIEDPILIARWQRELCTRLGLKGRIIVAHEGINGTVGGPLAAIEDYKKAMAVHPLFNDLIFKESTGGSEHFPRLKVVVKDEIVRLGISPQVIKAEDTAQHLTPEEVHQKISANPKDLVIFDARNNYESRIGAFIGAITPDISTFRQLPDFIDKNLDLFKDKEVVMYCTGGVRCERASAYLKTKNIARTVYQLSGGIHCYLEEFPEGYFRGKNFVFDARIALSTNNDVLTECSLCHSACDNYTHCINNACNAFFIMCKDCIILMNNVCSQECANQVSQGIPVRTAPYKVPVNHES